MKRKKVKLEFEYTNESSLKDQMTFIYNRLLEGMDKGECVRNVIGHKSILNIQQEYVKMRSFKLVTDNAIYIKSKI